MDEGSRSEEDSGVSYSPFKEEPGKQIRVLLSPGGAYTHTRTHMHTLAYTSLPRT